MSRRALYGGAWVYVAMLAGPWSWAQKAPSPHEAVVPQPHGRPVAHVDHAAHVPGPARPRYAAPPAQGLPGLAVAAPAAGPMQPPAPGAVAARAARSAGGLQAPSTARVTRHLGGNAPVIGGRALAASRQNASLNGASVHRHD